LGNWLWFYFFQHILFRALSVFMIESWGKAIRRVPGVALDLVVAMEPALLDEFALVGEPMVPTLD
jgi:hypothetical protein